MTDKVNASIVRRKREPPWLTRSVTTEVVASYRYEQRRAQSTTWRAWTWAWARLGVGVGDQKPPQHNQFKISKGGRAGSAVAVAVAGGLHANSK